MSDIVKISAENIDEVNRRLKYLQEHFDIDEPEEDIKIGDKDIIINFPDEYYNEPYDLVDFLKYTDDIEQIEVVNNSTVKCGKVSQTIIDVDSYQFEHLVPDVSFESDDFNLSIRENPFLIGIVATQRSLYDEDFGVYPCSMYLVVELEYKTGIRLPQEEEDKIIKSFLYIITSQFDVSIKIGEFSNVNWDDLTREETAIPKIVTINDLLPYTDAMEYFVNALSIKNDEIRYLYLYKIIEFFSPLVSKKKSYELLNQRLDALNIKSRDHRYLESIFQLTRDYEVSLKDRESANTVMNECVDIIELYEYLPESIQDTISKKCKFKKEEYTLLKADKIPEIKREIGTVLYSTRNNIVHAKSNYGLTGNECALEDLEQLNVFMAKLCHCLIVWNGRQSEEFQMK